MATNLASDPDLLDRALEVSGERTKKAAVTRALREFTARREQRRVLELMGKLEGPACSSARSTRCLPFATPRAAVQAVAVGVTRFLLREEQMER